MRTHWKVIIGVLGVVLPSFFTYLAARADSNEAKIRAEVAYVTMQENVKELQAASYQHALQLAKLEGICEADRRTHEKSSFIPGVQPLSPVRRPPVDADGIPDSPAPMQLRPPPNFSDAVQSYKAKK